jgi:NAD(P)H dehydrogenase (quinone)
VADFDRDPGNVRLRLAARKQADIEKMQAAGKDAVHFDLDDPQMFGTALAGVDRLFLLTGYTSHAGPETYLSHLNQ